MTGKDCDLQLARRELPEFREHFNHFQGALYCNLRLLMSTFQVDPGVEKVLNFLWENSDAVSLPFIRGSSISFVYLS